MIFRIIVSINEFLGKINISLYEICILIGVLCVILFTLKEFDLIYEKRKSNKLLLFLTLSMWVMLLFSILTDFAFHGFEGGIFDGSMTFLGGFVFGVIFFILGLKFIFKFNTSEIFQTMNVIIPYVILAHAIGRIGCFTAGCCYGKETTSFLGIIYPQGFLPYYIPQISGLKLHPVQLYESFALFVLFTLLICLRKKIKNYNMIIYLMSYGCLRLILEIFFRGDARGTLFNLPPSLIISSVMIMIGFGLFIWEKKCHIITKLIKN